MKHPQKIFGMHLTLFLTGDWKVARRFRLRLPDQEQCQGPQFFLALISFEHSGEDSVKHQITFGKNRQRESFLKHNGPTGH